MPPRAEKDELSQAMKALTKLLDDVAAHFGVKLSDSDRIAARSSSPPRA